MSVYLVILYVKFAGYKQFLERKGKENSY